MCHNLSLSHSFRLVLNPPYGGGKLSGVITAESSLTVAVRAEFNMAHPEPLNKSQLEFHDFLLFLVPCTLFHKIWLSTLPLSLSFLVL